MSLLEKSPRFHFNADKESRKCEGSEGERVARKLFQDGAFCLVCIHNSCFHLNRYSLILSGKLKNSKVLIHSF